MPKHIARLAPDGTVLHVSVVRDTVADALTVAAQIYGVPVEECRECGDNTPLAAPGWGWKDGTFAPPWVQVAGADTEPEGAESGYPEGAEVWLDGEIWVSTTDGNVWRPGEDAEAWVPVSAPR